MPWEAVVIEHLGEGVGGNGTQARLARGLFWRNPHLVQCRYIRRAAKPLDSRETSGFGVWGRRESDFWSRLANSLTINQFSKLAHILSNRWILENDTNATREEQNRNGSDHS